MQKTSVRTTSFKTSVTKTLSANNTTASVSLFRITGIVMINKLYGVVTTTIGANHTAGHFRLEDGTNTPAVTLATGVTLSAAGVGSLIIKEVLAGSNFTLDTSAQVRIEEPASGTPAFQQFTIVQKLSTNSDLVYRYTTTDTPTSGAIQFFVEWEPLSDGATLVGL